MSSSDSSSESMYTPYRPRAADTGDEPDSEPDVTGSFVGALRSLTRTTTGTYSCTRQPCSGCVRA